LIEAFRESNKDWIVSVAMISEGVDIKRLRVLVYLPNAQTELSFRQALGRVVRSAGKDDDSSAYVVMPTHNIFEEYARRVEREMKLIDIKDSSKNTKICPKCEEENDKKNVECKFCGYEFPQRKIRFKTCENEDCNHPNPVHLDECQSCGEKLGHDFIITLDNALRMGGIAREMDVDEDDVQQAEKYYKDIRKEILASGDARVIEVLSLFPDEALVKLKRILNKAGE
jgi:superfamily II DNA or RNA helicase